MDELKVLWMMAQAILIFKSKRFSELRFKAWWFATLDEMFEDPKEEESEIPESSHHSEEPQQPLIEAS